MTSAIKELKQQLHHSRSIGDWEEESKCLNAIAAKYKAIGEYVRAISYLEEDYSMLKGRKLSAKEKLELLLPTIQSLGELHRGRDNFEVALQFQKEHRDLALTLSHLDPANRELQRAECQLGVAYMDMADREKEDPWKSDSLLKLAKEHLTEALQLADAATLQKALVDAHNNLGLLAMQINDMPLAMKHLKTGLALCDKEYPDSEARLHHSLGTFFSKRGDKKEAVKHIREDIRICHQIKHLQGEGKGFLNLGDLHCKFHSYEDALDAYRKAESIFRGLTDEDELVKAAQNNIEVAIERRAAKQDLDDAPKDLRKLDIKLADAKGTDRERALQTRKAKKLRELIDIANRIDEFEKARAYAEQLADLALWLGDLGLQSDASLLVGEAYYNMQKYGEAEKWHRRSFEYSQKINSLEGMSVAMTNIGNCLDWLAQPEAASRAFQQSYEIAKKDGKLLDSQIMALGNLLCILERKKDDPHIRKVTKKLEQLERLKKEQRRVELVPDDVAQGSDSEGERPGPVPGLRNKEAEREKGRNEPHQAGRGWPPASGQQNPRSSGTEKGKGAETGKGPERRAAGGLVEESDAGRNREASRAGHATGVKTPSSSGHIQMRSSFGAEKSHRRAGSVPGADLSSGGNTAVLKSAFGGEKSRPEGGRGLKTSNESESPKETNGLLDRWLEKGTEGQPKKKPRLEGALHAGCGDVQKRGTGGGSGEGRRNEASASVVERGAGPSGGRRAVSRRPRVIMDSEESEEEEPIVIKRRRVECEGDGRGGDFGRGEKEGAEEGGMREGVEAERDRSGERNGVGGVVKRERTGEKKGSVEDRTGEKATSEGDSRGQGQRTREEGGKDEQGVYNGSKPAAGVHVNKERAQVARSAAVPSQAAKSGVTEQSKSGTMEPRVKVAPGKNQPGQPQAKEALKEITNERPGTQLGSNRGKSKEAPPGASHVTCLEDLVETQRVDPLTQMGDSEDPQEEDDQAEIPPENPLGSRATPTEPWGRSRESWERSTGAQNLKGPAGGQADGNSPANGASGGGARPSGSLGGRPVDLNEQSSAGPATMGGRKSQASRRETTSGNTGSFRGSQAKSILVKIHDQTLKVIIRAVGDKTPPKTVAWLIEEIVRLYSSDSVTGGSPVVRRLTHKGVTLKPIQIAEDVLGDLGQGEALEAHVDGWTRKPLLARYKAHCNALAQQPNAAVLDWLASKDEAEEEVELPGCGLTDDSAGPLLAALEECESLTSLNLSQNALGNSTVHKIQELLAAQPDLGFALDLHQNQLGPGALTQLSRCPVVLARLEVLDLSRNRLTDAAGRHLANLIENGSVLMALSLDNCGLTGRAIGALANAIRSSAPLTKLRIGHNNPVLGSALTALIEKLAALSSFSELDIAGLSVDPSAAGAVGRLLCRSQSLQILNMTDTNLRDAGAASLANALAAGGAATCCSIDLSSCHFSGLRAPLLCAQLVRIAPLTFLSLRGHKIGDEAASILRQSIVEPTSCLRQLDVSSCGLSEGTVVALVSAVAAAGVLEELRLARNCDFSKVVEPNSSSGPSKGVSPVPTDDKEVIPESDDEGDDSGPTHMVAKIRRKTADNLTQGLDSSKAGTRQDYTEGVPRNILAFESRMGARDGKARCCFDGLLAAVRSAESLHLLDLSENGLECDQFTQLRVAFQRDNSELEDGWQSGLLRML